MQSTIPACELITDRGQVIGFGRVKIPKMDWFHYEIPLLSFVVIKDTDGDYVATCIHLQIDGYGKTIKDAQIDMVDNVCYFLYENFNDEECKNSAWLNIYDLFKSNERSNLLWDAYHACQIIFAEKGYTTDRYTMLHEKIKELEEEVKKLQKEISKLNSRKNEDKTQFSPELLQRMIVESENMSAAA